MTNPKAGHTSASGMGTNAQGLRDGDGLTSPSLTNLYEGLHGNGIMRLGDGARGDSLRNSIVSNTPGFIEIGSGQGEVKVYGGHCVLDGTLYEFAGGQGSSETFVIGTTGAGANHSGDLPSVPSSNSDVFVVVYLVGRNSPEAHIMYEMGTPASPSSGTPLIPNRFLSNPSISGNTDANHQHTVIGVLRYTMTGGAGSVTASLNSNPTIHDRRTYLRSSPLYLTPMTKGSIGNVDTANALTDLDGFFASPEDGDFSGSTFGAIWQSHREDEAGNKHANIYASIPRNLNSTPVTNTYVIGPSRLEVITTTADLTFTFDQADLWVVTTDANRTINPSGTFGIGHVVQVYHASGAHDLHFDSTVGGHGATPINVNIVSGEFASFVYDGTNWRQISSANGVSYSDASAIAAVEGEATLDLTGAVTVGGNAVLTTASSATALSDVTAVGSGSIITSAERTKLTGIEPSADVTDEANVKSALDGMSLSDIGTPASDDKILIQDTSDSDNIKYVDYSEFTGIGNVVEDTTPQLGGDLDVNGFKILSDSGNENIVIHPHGTGQVVIGNQTGTVNRLSSNGARQLKMEANSGVGASITLDSGTNGDISIEPNGTGGVAVGTSTQDSNAILTVEGAISLDEISAPTNTADRGQLYTNSDNHLHFINGAGTDIKVTEEVFIVALSDEETDLTTGTGKASFHMPFAMTLTGVKATVNTAPTGATITVDINEGGTTILSTKLTIDASEKTSSTAATAAVISDSALANDAELTFDIDQVGSTVAGKGLKVTLYGYRA